MLRRFIFAAAVAVGLAAPALGQLMMMTGAGLGSSAAAPTSTAPQDTNTKLLSHFFGADGSTTALTECSANGHSVTYAGMAQVDTAQSKFGGESAFYNLSGAGASWNFVADHADFTLGTNNAEIDFWVRFQTKPSDVAVTTFSPSGLVSIATDANNMLRIYGGDGGSGNKLAAQLVIAAAADWSITSSGDDLVANQWYHVALTRNGTLWQLWQDGVEVGSVDDATSVPDFTSGVYAGAINDTFWRMDGWIDELRISNGDSRWSSAFAPATIAYKCPFIAESVAASAQQSTTCSTTCTWSSVAYATTTYDNTDLRVTFAMVGGSAAGARTVSSATICGAAATEVAADISSTATASIYYKDTTADSNTCNFVTTNSGTHQNGAIAVFNIINPSSAAPTAATCANNASQVVTLSINTPTDGATYAWTTAANGTNRTFTWSGLSEIADGVIETAVATRSYARGTTSGTPLAITATASGTVTGMTGCSAAWTKATS